MIFILFLRLAPFEEEVSEPYLSQMGLVFVRSVDLFHSVENLRLEVKPFPNL
jgi:hypothetical protein